MEPPSKSYFGSITAWVKAAYTDWGKNWHLQVGDSMQGDANRFYISPDAPLNTPLARAHVDIYADLDIYFDGNEFYYYDASTRIKISASGVDEIGHYVQFISGRVCTEIFVEGALWRRPDCYAKKGGCYVKPISVGDKLGLVYWDGYVTPTTGGAIRSTSTLPGYTNARVWCGSDSTASGPLFLNWYISSLVRQDRLLAKPGTINLSEFELTVAQIETSTSDYLANHLWHVI